MRRSWLARLLVVVLVLVARPAPAQQPGPVRINHVRFGLAPGLTRPAAWAPVYVDLTAGPGGLQAGQAVLVTQTMDNDLAANDYTVPVPPAAPNQFFTVQTLVRPGLAQEAFTVHVRDPATGQDLCPRADVVAPDRGPEKWLIVAVGSAMEGMIKSLAPEEGKESTVAIATIDRVERLPEQWFGYDAVDVLLLSTGDRAFLASLLDDQDPLNRQRRAALTAWVQRGGRLVVDVGRNQDLIVRALAALLPVRLDGTQRLAAGATPVYVGSGWQHRALPPLPGELETAKWTARPERDTRPILEHGDRQPLAVQAAFGLGRVTVIGFAWDDPVIISWPGQSGFWRGVLKDNGVAVALPPGHHVPSGVGVINQLRGQMETFEDVPVISFGLVAVLILLYVLLVGPLEYWLLKRVVGRLELTWITFPATVVIVSVCVYAAAHAVKGREPGVHKVDLIDVDLASGTSFGHSWFAVYSPQTERLTIGLEAAPAWSGPADGLVLDWMGGPAPATWSGPALGRGHVVFRRPYEYATAASGLVGVPVQAWSTRAFAASWQAAPPARGPLFTADLHVAPNQTLAGQITSHLPLPLDSAVLLYPWHTDIKVVQLGTVEPGQAVAVEGRVPPGINWLQFHVEADAADRRRPRAAGAAPSPLDEIMKWLLFHGTMDDRASAGGQADAGLGLDQGWRVLNPPHGPARQAILYGRLAAVFGPAATINTGPAQAARLWLGRLPEPGANPPPLDGVLRQQTFVRVFVPVKDQ